MQLNKICDLDAKIHYFPKKSKKSFFEEPKIKNFSNRDIDKISSTTCN